MTSARARFAGFVWFGFWAQMKSGFGYRAFSFGGEAYDVWRGLTRWLQQMFFSKHAFALSQQKTTNLKSLENACQLTLTCSESPSPSNEQDDRHRSLPIYGVQFHPESAGNLDRISFVIQAIPRRLCSEGGGGGMLGGRDSFAH